MIQTLFGPPEPTFLEKMKEAVTRTRENLGERIDEVMAFTKEIDRGTLDDLEAILISADLGATTTHEILDKLREKADRKQIKDAAELKRLIQDQIREILNSTPSRAATPLRGDPEVVMIVGVNGTGKTTTIGKLAYALRGEGKTVLLCAADTFRAAAVEQLEIWAQRNGIDVIKQKSGADPAAVVFDAVTAAKARGADAVLVDTAGRLHTKSNLMAELEKMKRTAAKVIPGAPHDVLLVLDATTGQNGLAQAREFTSAVTVTGIILTKLDGTAKGGIVVAIARELGLPIRFVGTGEQINDMVPFDAETYANSLFD